MAKTKTNGKVIMTDADIARTLKRIANEIVEKNKGVDNVVIIGIMERGYPLAKRIAGLINDAEGKKIPAGGLDVSLYRDDISIRGKSIKMKKSDISFSVDKKVVVLVDDVFYRGRTTRAALDSLNDYGRPSKVQLAVLVDRGGRELPIEPDFCGKKVTITSDEEILVHVSEIDGADEVVVR